MSNLHRKLLPKLCKPKDDDCDDDHELSPVQVLMICFLAVFFCLLCYISIVKTCRALQARRRRRINSGSHGININTNEEANQDFIDADHEPVVFHPVWLINTVGLDQSVIDSIEIFKYREEDGLIDTDCPVCLGVFQEDESLRILPKCSHAFHVACIDTWLRSHKNCPVCRAPVVKNASIPQTDTNSVESGTQEEIPLNWTIRFENKNDQSQGDSSEKNSCTSRVRVQSDLTNQCFQKLEPMRRSVSIGSFRFADQELVASQKPDVGPKSGKRRRSGSSMLEEGRALRSTQESV